MKITSYVCHTVSAGWRNITYCIIETDEGIQGVGEAHVVGKTHTVQEYLKEIQRHIIGHEVYDIESLYEKLTLVDFGLPGQVVMSAMGLLEMACWDCIGKKAGLPVYKLIGGAVREKIPVYANGWYRVSRDPEHMHQAAVAVLEMGYTNLKFDPFGNGKLELTKQEFDLSIAIIEAVHEAISGKGTMLIEMHGRFAPHQAVAIARRIEAIEPGWIEEPCRPNDIEALQYVIDHTGIPVAVGERLYTAYDYSQVFRDRLANIIQPDISQCGGLLEVKKIASFAEIHSMTVAPHNVGGVVSTLAGIHLMATLRNGKILEHFNDFSDTFLQGAGNMYPEVRNGYMELPQQPGWGVEIDPAFFDKYKPRRENGVIQDPGLDMFRNKNWHQRKQPEL